MADNISVTQGTGTSIATDDVGGVQYQKVKLVDGTADSSTVIAGGAGGLEVDLKTDSIGGLEVVQDTAGDLNVTEASASAIQTATEAVQTAVEGTLSVDLGANNDVTVTSGTIDLGATDNAVLDAIVTATEATQTAVEGTLTVDATGQGDVPITLDGETVTVDLGANNDVTVTGTVALTNDSIVGAGDPVITSYAHAVISSSADTANQSLISAQGANTQIWVYGIEFTAGTGDGTVSFQDEDDTAISGVMEFTQTGGMVVSPSGNFSMPMWKVATNKALEVDTVTCDIKGSIQYAVVDVS